MKWTALLAVILALCSSGCGVYQGEYYEEDYIDLENIREASGRIDFEEVLHNKKTAGYVESIYSSERDSVDYFVYSANFDPVGYISPDGATYRYSHKLDSLKLEGHFPLLSSVRHLLGLDGAIYITSAYLELTWEQLEQLQTGMRKAKFDR